MSISAVLSFPGHGSHKRVPVPSRIVARWLVGYFAENTAVTGDAAVFVGLHSHTAPTATGE